MDWKRESADGSNSAIYLPRISRTVVDQLDSHLRTFNLKYMEEAGEPTRVMAGKRSAEASAEAGASVLRSDQLESTLVCIKKAARTMADLVEQVGSVGEREKLKVSLARVEDRLGVFERTFEAMSDELLEAKRDAEEQRCRALAAENRLENLVAAVTKMIAPLGFRDSFDPGQIPPKGGDSSGSYGERA